jgi:prepilin-type N-terminal cleavage/methylation domain-containing protein
MGERRTTGKGRTGFTLIELTIVLAVIVTLALVMTPSIASSINDARVARAQNDSQAIAGGIYQFFRDTGHFPIWRAARSGGAGTSENRLPVLVSGGSIPIEDVPTLWTTGATGGLREQLVDNAPGYAIRTVTSQFGWNGPYVSSGPGADPWGHRYAVNVALLDLSPGAATASGSSKMAVWVLSAGPNGIIETPFASSILRAAQPGGDDIGTRIQ